MQAERKHSASYFFIVLICCGFAAASLGICVNSDGAFYSAVCEALGLGRGPVAIYATLSGLATGILSPVVMRLIKKVNLKLIVSIGVMMAAGATFGMSLANNIWIFYICGIIRGSGCACFALAVVTTVLGNWFTDKVGTMSGIATGFSGLAGALFNSVFSSIITAYGYKVAYVVSALLILALALPGALLVLKLTPEEKGLVAHASTSVKTKKTTVRPRSYSRLSGTSSLFVMVIVLTMCSNFVSGLSTQLSGHAENIGMGAAFGASMISMVMIGNVASKIIIGMLCDTIGAARAMIVMLTVNVVAIAIFALAAPQAAVLIGASILFGSIYGAAAVGLTTLARQVYGNEQYASVAGTVVLFSSATSAFAFSIIGFLYDLTEAYMTSFILCAALDILGILMVVLISMKSGLIKGKTTE